MSHALSLARLARGEVSPNPAVGAVIVKNDHILGQGYTQPPGQEHAEIVALKQAGREAKDATLYVTLEPCCHFGRTPPCTNAIINAGISEVYYAMLDPNPLVAGKGQHELEKAGIRTYPGGCAAEAAELNEAYIKYITRRRPFVTVKIACSLDGKIATRSGESRWITGESSRKQVQQMRYFSDAVMTGANTVIMDDPRLTVRISIRGGIAHRQPLRIIIDGMGRVPPTARIFSEPGSTLLVIGSRLSDASRDSLAGKQVKVLEMPSENGIFRLEDLLKYLGEEKQISNVMVEAGGTLLGSLFDQGLVDKVTAFIAPIIIGGEEARPVISGQGFGSLAECPRLKRIKVERFDADIMVSGYLAD